MGVLIMMPARNTTTAQEAKSQEAVQETVQHEVTQENEASAQAEKSPIDFSVWKNAPKERTPNYFPVYSTVSRAIQSALRRWVAEWFAGNPEILLRPHSAYPILVYQCTHPFAGKPTNIFTYDIQQTEVLDRAFRSAAHRLGRQLASLDTKSYSWFTREHYFAYRSKEVVKYVAKNRRAIYKMLNTDTMLMDSILKFVMIDMPKMGVEEASVILRKAFITQLRRFSNEFDFTGRADELLQIATDALLGKLPTDNVVEMPLAA